MEKKIKIKSWFDGTRMVLKCSLCFFLSKWFGIKCEEHPFFYILSAMLILPLLTLFLVIMWNFAINNGEKYLNFALVNAVNNHSITDTDLESQHVEDVVGSGCDLEKNKWSLWLGNISTDAKDKGSYLPITEKSALFKYSGKIEDFSGCEFVFSPRGDDVVNYVISVDGIYQIVVGDNDYWTISLKSTDEIEGILKSVKEIKSKNTRPHLSYKIKKGTNVQVLLKQSFVEKNKYQVKVTINYKGQDKQGDIYTKEDFTWNFTPSPLLLNHQELDLSVGLIRSKDDKSKVGVNFINPKLD